MWANSLTDALDEAVDWIAEYAPGLLCDDEVAEEYRAARDEGLGDEAAQARAEEDTTCAGNNGHFTASHDWHVVAEDPSRREILALLGR